MTRGEAKKKKGITMQQSKTEVGTTQQSMGIRWHKKSRQGKKEF